MRFAIFSDLHDHLSGLLAVERDAQRRQADRLLFLGDAGHAPAVFDALRSRGVTCLFGNWEVSGMARLPATLRAWVATWPATLRLGDVLCCHATPDSLAGVATTTDAAAQRERGLSWHALFPRLHTQVEARIHAWAALDASGLVAAFHGHTHIQQVWRYPPARGHSFVGPTEFALPPRGEPGVGEPQLRYLIGVGSAGAPQDGPALRYALYDEDTRVVTLVAVAPRAS